MTEYYIDCSFNFWFVIVALITSLFVWFFWDVHVLYKQPGCQTFPPSFLTSSPFSFFFLHLDVLFVFFFFFIIFFFLPPPLILGFMCYSFVLIDQWLMKLFKLLETKGFRKLTTRRMWKGRETNGRDYVRLMERGQHTYFNFTQWY